MTFAKNDWNFNEKDGKNSCNLPYFGIFFWGVDTSRFRRPMCMAPNSGDECRHLRGPASAEDDGVQSLRRPSPDDATQIGNGRRVVTAECCYGGADGELIVGGKGRPRKVCGESKRGGKGPQFVIVNSSQMRPPPAPQPFLSAESTVEAKTLVLD